MPTASQRNSEASSVSIRGVTGERAIVEFSRAMSVQSQAGKRMIAWLTPIFLATFSFILAGVLYGCSSSREYRTTLDPTPSPAHRSCDSELAISGDDPYEVNMQRWQQQRNLNYDMTLAIEMSSFVEPARKVAVEVRNGVAVSLVVPDANDKRGGLSFYERYRTVDLIFEGICKLRQEGGTVVTEFNETYGYPQKLQFTKPAPDSSFTLKVLHLEFVGNDDQ